MAKSILPPLTFLTYSLGCRTNQAEIESISMKLLNNGFEMNNGRNSPDIVLLNTCVVTSKAEKETRQKIRELRKKYPKSFLVVLGCGVDAKNKFAINLPEADLFISNEEKDDSVQIILKRFCHSDQAKRVEESLSPAARKGSLDFARDDGLNNKYIQSGRKFIKIQDGCNGGCSFCLTQFVRGEPTSVPPEKVIEEVNFWVEKGIKEIILTGVNIGLYRNDMDSRHSDQAKCVEESLSPTKEERDPSTLLGMTIVNLISQIQKKTSIERLSFSSIYPEMVTEEFLALVVENPRISQCFHLSLQSGSQTVLKRMNRKTNLDKLLKKLQWIKEKNPNFTFRADIITGFPDETETEFQETIDFIKKAKISFIHHFHFSRRQHTKLEVMIKNKVWKEVLAPIKKQRAERLKKVVEKIRNNEAVKQLNTITNCLIVKKNNNVIASLDENQDEAIPKELQKSNGIATACQTGRPRNDIYWEGITENGWNVKIKLKNQSAKIKDLKGKILPVKITGFEKNYLLGERG